MITSNQPDKKTVLKELMELGIHSLEELKGASG